VSDGRERLTPRVRRVLAMAEDEAIALRHAEVGTEHLLLGLLREGRGLAARALHQLGVEPAELAQRVRVRLVPAPFGPDGPATLGPGVRAALDMARTEAARLHHDYVGTEHVLLGLLRDGEGPAFLVLSGAGITLAQARQEILAIMNESTPELPSGRSGSIAVLRGRERSLGRHAGRDDDAQIHAPERCGHCGRGRRPEWRFCAFCGERWPLCGRCETPLPILPAVRFCPGCGIMVGTDEE
jgi:ATP-dependent Clp protease ATP-binding subunit ClpA